MADVMTLAIVVVGAVILWKSGIVNSLINEVKGIGSGSGTGTGGGGDIDMEVSGDNSCACSNGKCIGNCSGGSGTLAPGQTPIDFVKSKVPQAYFARGYLAYHNRAPHAYANLWRYW